MKLPILGHSLFIGEDEGDTGKFTVMLGEVEDEGSGSGVIDGGSASGIEGGGSSASGTGDEGLVSK